MTADEHGVVDDHPAWSTHRYDRRTMVGPPPLPLPPPVVAASPVAPALRPPAPPHPTLPLRAAVGAVVVLTASLVASKLVLDALVDRGWPVLVYVVLLLALGYGPSLVWCVVVSRRWANGRVAADLGLVPRWADLGWGPVIWLAAVLAQLAVTATIVALGVPLSNNTDGVSDLAADRTYVVSVVIAAVIAAPIVEELVFRGVVLRGLRSVSPAVIAVALQGVLFGLAHVDPVRGAGNVGLAIVLAAVGIVFGLFAYVLRRIGPTIVAHAIFNGVVLVLVLSGLADRLADAMSAR